MIIHYNHDKPTSVYVVNSRRLVYRAYYGDGLGNTIAGYFAGMAPKVVPLVKQLGMKAIHVIHDIGINAVGNLAGKAFSAAKDQIISLARQRKKPVVLHSTTVMTAKISKAINNAVEEKLTSLEAAPFAASSLDTKIKTIAIMIAGGGFKQKRNSKNFHR